MQEVADDDDGERWQVGRIAAGAVLGELLVWSRPRPRRARQVRLDETTRRLASAHHGQTPASELVILKLATRPSLPASGSRSGKPQLAMPGPAGVTVAA